MSAKMLQTTFILVVIVFVLLVGSTGQSLYARKCSLKDINLDGMETGAASDMTFDYGDVLFYNGEEFKCLEYGWRDSVKETGTSTTVALHPRQKRFVEWVVAAVVVAYVACMVFCPKPKPPNKSPYFVSCPKSGETYIADPGRRDSVVTWTTPKARDPEDGYLTPKLVASQQSGSRFPEGRGTVQYIVKDSRGAVAICYFSFTVSVKRCTPIDFPDHGLITCEVQDFLYGTKCTLKCAEGYEISTKANNNEQHIMCTLDASNKPIYDVSVATCKVIKCDGNAPELKPKNGKAKCGNDDFIYNTNCAPDCDTGFAARDLSQTVCQSDKTWSKPLGDCFDVEPPVIRNCPSSFNVATERSIKQARVQWNIPTATDNAGKAVVKQETGPSPGSYVDVGKHEIRYQAWDETGNNSTRPCIFFITVFEQTCNPPFIDDKYMRYNCTSGYGYGASCQLSCLGTFPFIGNESISCERFEKDVDWTWDKTKQHCQRNPCEELDPPTNGAISCAAWLFGLICQMQCSEPYDIPFGTRNDHGGVFTGQFVCSESTGKWTPGSVPDCSERRNADDVYVLGEYFYYTGDCNNETVLLTIKENFINNMKQMQENGFDGVCPDDTECNVDNVVVTCGNTTNRRKRELSNDDLIRNKRSTYELKVQFRIYTKSNSSSSLKTDSFQTFKTVLNNITEQIRESVKSGNQNVDGFVADPESLQVGQAEISCPRGTFLRLSTLSCVPCSAGSVFNDQSGRCESCPLGTYKEYDMDESCSVCPMGTSTLTTGSKNYTDCLEICPPGYFSRTGLAPCSPCPVSSYQHGNQSTSCIPCAAEKTTLFLASQKEEDCTDFDYVFLNEGGQIYLGQTPNNLTSFTITMWIQVSHRSWINVWLSSPTSKSLQLDYHSGEFSLSTERDQESVNLTIPERRWTLVSYTMSLENGSIGIYVNGEPAWSTNHSQRTMNYVSTADWHISLVAGTNDSSKVSLTGFNLLDYIQTEEEIKQYRNACHFSDPRSLISMGSVVNVSNTNVIKGVPSRCMFNDPCKENPCNGHSCSPVDDGFVCHCRDGFSGVTCTVEPDYCVNDPCENSINCANVNGSFTCTCKSGYKGTRCTDPIVNGAWGTWEPWSDCSASCGGGNRTRRRDCNSPPPGPEGLDCDPLDSDQTEACNTADCPTCGPLQRRYMNKLTCAVSEDGHHECKVTCKMGYSFLPNQMPDDLYVCGPNTSYRWSNTPPSCSASKTPESLSTQTTLTYQNVTCDEKSDVRRQVESKAAREFRCLKNKTCSMQLDINGCSETESNLDVTITLISHLEANLTLEPITSLENASKPVLDLINAVVDLEFSVHQLNVSSNLSDIMLNNVIYSPSSIETEGKVECMDGQGRIEATCVECPVGTFARNSKCELCEFGSYQDIIGQTQCKPCQKGFTTDLTGAKDISFCTEALKTTVSSTVGLADTTTIGEISEVLKIKDEAQTTTILIAVFSAIAVIAVVAITLAVVVFCKRYIYVVNDRKSKANMKFKDQKLMDTHQNPAFEHDR